jgi:hypothetical protein
MELCRSGELASWIAQRAVCGGHLVATCQRCLPLKKMTGVHFRIMHAMNVRGNHYQTNFG